MNLWRRYQIWRLSRKLAHLRVQQAYLVGKHEHRFPDETDVIRAICDYSDLHRGDCYKMRDLCVEVGAVETRLAQISLPRVRVRISSVACRLFSRYYRTMTNDTISVHPIDEADDTGARHQYEIRTPNQSLLKIRFQKGPIQENEVNGIQHVHLIRILIDRLEGFQLGPYASDHNETTLLALRTALQSENARTRSRQARGVEGTSKL